MRTGRPRGVRDAAAWSGVAAACAWTAWQAWVHREHFVDDSFIGLRYARNLLSGHGLVFNPGEWIEGITNLGWVAVVAGAAAVLGGPDLLPAVAKALGLVFTLATILLTARAARRLTPGNAPGGSVELVAVPILVATQPDLTYFALAAMETGLAALLLVLALWCLLPERPRWLPLAAVGAALFTVRPETVVILPGVLGLLVLRWFFGKRTELGRIVWSGALFGVLVSAVTLVRWAYYGAVLPNTFVAKAPTSALEVLGRVRHLALGSEVNVPAPYGSVLFLGVLVGWVVVLGSAARSEGRPGACRDISRGVVDSGRERPGRGDAGGRREKKDGSAGNSRLVGGRAGPARLLDLGRGRVRRRPRRHPRPNAPRVGAHEKEVGARRPPDGALRPAPPTAAVDALAAESGKTSHRELATQDTSTRVSGSARLSWAPWVFVVVTVGVGLFFGIYAPPDWSGMGRYFGPYVPLAALLLVRGVGAAAGRVVARSGAAPEKTKRAAGTALALGFGLLVVLNLWRTGGHLAPAALDATPGFILASEELVPAARWIEEHLPPDAVVAARRIGALGYFGRRPVFDYAYGLTDSRAARAVRAHGGAFHTPAAPELAGLWQTVRPAYLLEDLEAVGPLISGFVRPGSRFRVHGMRYQVMRVFPVGDAEWVLAGVAR